MLKEMLASNAAKLVAACVCPVVAGGVALQVPKVRSAVHKATAPKPRTARAKPRVRTPAKQQLASSDTPLPPPLICAQPPILSQSALTPASLDMPVSLPPPEIGRTRFDAAVPSPNCGPVGFAGGGLLTGMGMVPEPATWAQMIAGFALAGMALRRRRRCNIRVTSLS